MNDVNSMFQDMLDVLSGDKIAKIREKQKLQEVKKIVEDVDSELYRSTAKRLNIPLSEVTINDIDEDYGVDDIIQSRLDNE